MTCKTASKALVAEFEIGVARKQAHDRVLRARLERDQDGDMFWSLVYSAINWDGPTRWRKG